jgi:hypothetical protein
LWTAWVTALVLAIAFLPAVVWPTTAPRAQAATTCGAGCHVTVNAQELSGAPIANFTFIVNLDNTKLPADPLSLSTESNSPIVATGDQSRRTVTLPAGRYLISVRSLDHKMWGNYLTLPDAADASGNVTVNVALFVTQLPQAPNMTFFVTGAGPGKGADLGGIEGADQYCQTLAQRHGAGGKTWRAYLSTQEAAGKPAVNARDRIGNGPWQNFKGQVVATSLDDLHSDNNKLGFDNSLSERGQIIPGVGFAPNRHDVLTGSTPEGRPTISRLMAPASPNPSRLWWVKIVRGAQSNGSVKWSTGLQPLSEIANVEHFVPRDWISEDGCLPNEKFIAYARPLIEGEEPVLHTAKKPEPKIPKRIKIPDFARRLPKEIRQFTTKGVYDLGKKTHLSFVQGAGHGGSHPHLVHEFLTALVKHRQPYPNARQSANWTCVGLCAHASALKGGAIVKLPAFTI